MVPDRDPFARLQAALLQSGFDLEQASSALVVSEQTLTSICATLRTPNEPWLIFIDQFEEIFTLCAEPTRRQAFLDGLARLIESGPAEIKLVAAMRSDFFDRFDPHPRLLEVTQPPFFVTSPSPAELRLCIEQPAARHGVTFEAGLVSEILQDLKGQPGALPLLQYTLDLLWKEDCPAYDRTLNTVNYRALGGISGALKQRADDLYEHRALDRQRTKTAPRSKEQRDAMRRVFLRLLDLSEQGENARVISNRAPLTEFMPDEQELVAELTDATLLVTNRSDETSSVEVAHEALLSAWPRLNEWIAQTREVIYTRNRLRADAAVWDKSRQASVEKANEELWTGSRLQTALEHEERGELAQLGGLSPLMREFLTAGRALRDRRTREEQDRREQRTRLLRFGIAVLSIFLIIAGGTAYYARKQQKEAITQKLAAEQRELDLVIEHGRHLLVDQKKPLDAALWLQRALERGSMSHTLPHLLAAAMRPVDATRLVLIGHKDAVGSTDYSPDGLRIVTASDDRTAKVWDAQTGKLLLSLQGHDARVASARYSPDGLRIVTASADRTARVWDAQTGKPILSLQGHTYFVLNASFSPDGRRIVTASEDTSAGVWDAQTGTLLFSIQGPPGPVESASFSPDGRHIVTVSGEDNTARVWDAQTGKPVLSLQGHEEEVRSAAYSPNGQRIVTVSSERHARVWDAQSGKPLLSLQGHAESVKSASFSPDGRRIVTTSYDKTARVWDAQTGTSLFSLQGHQGTVWSASFSPDGSRIVTASADKSARVWDAQTVKCLLSLRAQEGSVGNPSYSPDGRRIVTTGNDKIARIWDAQTGKPLLSLKGNAQHVMNASYSPDGRRIVTVSNDENPIVWDAHTGKSILALKSPKEYFWRASFSPDGRHIVTASQNKTARVWDAHTGKLLLSLQGHDADVASASFSPDQSRIVTASDDKTARVWDAHTGKSLLTLKGHEDSVRSASYSLDGSRIVTASSDKTARVWDAHTGKPLLILQGHEDSVGSASFSPDGSRIITTASDNTARVWDAQTGKPLLTLQDHKETVGGASFSPDGSRIVTDFGKTVQVWQAGAETRSTEQLALLLRCRLALRLDGSLIVRVPLDTSGCSRLPEPEPPLPRWDQRDWPLWAGIYALQAGHKDVARTRFQEARTVLTLLQDDWLLSHLYLAEAALDAIDDGATPTGLVERIGKAPPHQQAAQWMALASFAYDELHRPRWALWAFDQGFAVDSRDVSRNIEAVWRANRLEILLSTGAATETLREGPTIWNAQQDLRNKVIVAAIMWIAAGQQATGNERPLWAKRIMEDYAKIKDATRLGWAFSGSRHALLNQPDSEARIQALELLTLLEEPTSTTTADKLAKLLKIPWPRPVRIGN